MKVSVIIPVYNEEKEIIDCLESLGRQSYSGFEIIVIDDGSTGKAKNVIQNLTKLISSVTILQQNHKGPGAARNFGVKKAKGEVLVFVDADMTFDTDFLVKLVTPILKGRAKGTFSKEEFVSNWNNVWARCWNLNEDWEEKRRHLSGYPDKQKVFRAILKSEFEKVGGFTPGGYTDDYSLYEKLGYEANAAPGAIFYHENPPNLIEVFKQAKWVGKRQYKFGTLGLFVALLRVLLPISFVLGTVKALIYKVPAFLVFKIIYDFGVFMGIWEMIILGKVSK